MARVDELKEVASVLAYQRTVGVDKRIEELERENAELKKNKKTVVHLAECLEEKQKEHLTKAKELLAKWVELYKPKSDTALPTPIQVDTEQFLKEIEK